MPTTTIQPIAPVQCAPWCEDGTGHTDVLFASDQTCYGADLTVDLSRYPAVQFDADDLRPEVAHVFLARRAGEDAPHVQIGLGDLPTMELTAVELRQLIEQAQLLLGVLGAVREAEQ